MDSHFEALREARASLPDEVRQTADALLKLLEATAGAPTPVRAALRVACEGVGHRLSETHLTIALVGDAGAGRRTLINALLGDRVLPTSTPRRGSTITIVRRAPTLEFSACSLDGRSVARLSRKTPDRDALFEKSMAQIDRETTATEALTASLQAARQRAAALETAFHDGDDGEQLREGTAALAAFRKPAPLRSLRGRRSWARALVVDSALGPPVVLARSGCFPGERARATRGGARPESRAPDPLRGQSWKRRAQRSPPSSASWPACGASSRSPRMRSGSGWSGGSTRRSGGRPSSRRCAPSTGPTSASGSWSTRRSTFLTV